MGVPYEPAPTGGHVTTGPTPLVIAVDVPSRTRIYKLLVNQVGGADGFTVDVYNNALAAAGSNNLDADGNAVPPGNYKVTNTLTGTAGKLAYHADLETGGYGFPFFNQDPPDTYKRFNKRTVYLVITVAGAGAGVQKTFALTIGLDSAEL